MVSRGYQLLSEYAQQTGIPVEHTGAVLVAWDDEQLDALPSLQEKAEANGYTHCEIIDAAAVYAQIPDLGTGVLGGLTVPDESIICTWTVNLALATDAVNRGAALLTEPPRRAVEIDDETTTLHTSAGPVTARWVINAAGLGADLIDALFGYSRFTVTPRRGELSSTTSSPGPWSTRSSCRCRPSRGKGVLVSPTIYGNVMLGPTSEDLQDRTATGTSQDGFDFLLEKGRALMPRLLDEEVTATYAGLRAAIDHGDYLIEADAAQRYLLVGGIRSTGLTAGMAIAEYVRDMAAAMRAATWCRGRICRAAHGCPTSARPSPARTRTPTGSPRTPSTAPSCASASASPQANCATRSAPPSHPPGWTGCAGAPA